MTINPNQVFSFSNMSALPASSLSLQKNLVPAKCFSPEQSGSTVPPDTPGVCGNTCVPYFHPQQPSAWWRATQCAGFLPGIVYRNPSSLDPLVVKCPWMSLTSLDSLSRQTASGGSLWGTVSGTADSPCSAEPSPISAVPATEPSAKIPNKRK